VSAEPATTGFERILVPTDLSEESLVSLQYARFFAERFCAKLTLLHVDAIIFLANEAGTAVPLSLVSTPEHIAALE